MVVAPARIPLLVLLAGREHDYQALARPLLHALERTHQFAIDVASHASAIAAPTHAVVIAASDEPLEAAHAAALHAFVRGGGGLILMHSTLAGWSEQAHSRQKQSIGHFPHFGAHFCA